MFERYKKQMIIPGFGEEGQKKLKDAKVLIAGTGGLGSPVSLYLTAAGIGTLGLVDCDTVDVTNLQRQVLHFTNDVNRAKVDSASKKLTALNPDVKIQTYNIRIEEENINEIIQPYDIIVDAVDNAKTRYLINDYCYLHAKPVVEGSVSGVEGMMTIIIPDKTPCYRCIFPEGDRPESKPVDGSVGILGVTAGHIGTLMAFEVIKWLVGFGDLAASRLVLFNGGQLKYREILLQKRSGCSLCANVEKGLN